MKKTSFIVKAICIAMCFLLFLFVSCDAPNNPPPTEQGEESFVSFIDVGDAESIFIKLPDGKTVLIDCGNKQKEQKIVDFIKEKSVDKIDVLVITHPDADHIGGAKAVLDNFVVDKIYHPQIDSELWFLFPSYAEFMSSVIEKSIETQISTSYSNLSGQGYFLSILSPDNKSVFYKEINGTLSPSSEQIDCISAVVYLKVNGVRFLFTGDAKYAVEEKIKLNYLNKVYNTFYQNELVALEDIDFLKVSNGGADGCSGREFLELLKPKNAIIFTSGNSAPSNLVLNRLYESNKDYKLYRTDVYGTITVSQMSKGNYKIFTEA